MKRKENPSAIDGNSSSGGSAEENTNDVRRKLLKTDRKVVLAIGAHPDDIEIFMAGTLLLLRQKGFDLHYMTLANGCCGTTVHDKATISEIRSQEAQNAAKLLRAVYYPPICDDMQIVYNTELVAKVTSVVRKANPDIVLTHAPIDYMEDHTNTSRIALAAVFSRSMINADCDPHQELILKDVVVYHAQPHGNRDPLRKFIIPEILVDISTVIEQKAALLAEHKSQKEWLDTSQGMDSYLQTMKDLNEEMGRYSCRYQFAEGWRRHLHYGYSAKDTDPLSAVLDSYSFLNPQYQAMLRVVPIKGIQKLPIVLGSSSKWRQQILKEMGYEFTVVNPNIDEKAIRDPNPVGLTLKIARAKANKILKQMKKKAALLITCDQVIVFQEKIREKPKDAEECRAFLRSYANGPAEAVCGMVVVNTKTGKTAEGSAIAKQYFNPLPEEFIEKLIQQGDVLHCAGGFAIELMEGYLGKREGERETIMGLPRTVTRQLLDQLQKD